MESKTKKLNLRRKLPSSKSTINTNSINRNTNKNSCEYDKLEYTKISQNDLFIRELENERDNLYSKNNNLSKMLDNLNLKLFGISQLIQSIKPDDYFDPDDVIEIPFQNPITNPKKRITYSLYQASRYKYNTCSICLEEFSNSVTVAKLGCNHIFHTSCINRWLNEDNFCPNCKQ